MLTWIRKVLKILRELVLLLWSLRMLISTILVVAKVWPAKSSSSKFSAFTGHQIQAHLHISISQRLLPPGRRLLSGNFLTKLQSFKSIFYESKYFGNYFNYCYPWYNLYHIMYYILMEIISRESWNIALNGWSCQRSFTKDEITRDFSFNMRGWMLQAGALFYTTYTHRIFPS